MWRPARGSAGRRGMPAMRGSELPAGTYIEESAFPEWKTSDERTTAGTLPWLIQ